MSMPSLRIPIPNSACLAAWIFPLTAQNIALISSPAQPNSENAKRDSNNTKRDSSNAKRESSNAKRESNNTERESSNTERESNNTKRDSNNAERESENTERESEVGEKSSVVEEPVSLLIAPFRTPITLDGDFSDWRGANWTLVTPRNGTFDAEAAATTDPLDLGFRFALCHDNSALYVAVEVTDDAVVADSTRRGGLEEPAWDDDAIEVFLDGNFNRAPDARDAKGAEKRFGGEFSLVSNGAATSQFSGFPRTFGQPKRWQGAVKRMGARTMRYEFRLDFRVLGGKIGAGDTVGFTLAAQDDDDGGGRDHSLYWRANSPHGWQNEAGWGAVYLALREVRRPR